VRDGLTPVSSSAAGTPSAAFTDAPTLALKPAAPDGATGSTIGTPRGRTLWILMSIAVLAGALGIVGWGLFRGAIPTGAPEGEAGRSPHEDGRALTDQEVEVLAVEGLGGQEARKRLDEAGLQVEVRSRESSEEDTGRVLEQSVAGGKKAKEGSAIILTVGEGPEVARVPDLVGLTYSEAEGELQHTGFLLGGVQEVSSETVPEGVIASQDPQAGSTLERGSYVYLTTSIGSSAETAQVF
jgi:hypothetical protein